jgi:uridine phosphorylase
MEKEQMIPDSELVLNPDGTVYHLKIRPENLADKIILVGDPGRVKMVSALFDSIEYQGQNREFTIHTGTFRQSRITVMSTGMGTDNMDIVLNELDALANIDLSNRRVRDDHRSLLLFRLGTSGSLQPDLPVNAVVVSSHGIGLDGMIWFYRFQETPGAERISRAFRKHVQWDQRLPVPYAVEADEQLVGILSGEDVHLGMTATAPGFYGPQGRKLRIPTAFPHINEALQTFRFGESRILNYEMETSALYGLSRLLGHRALTVCLSIANRYTGAVSKDYHRAMENLALRLLESIANLKG